ncbi:MAG: rhomboid family intramembrane serine protease [Chitinophagaceae bacterium]|nr:MAG: rhomboid family intramembrane serine protease [Chitinophagaceae bacterium]
MLPIPIGDDNSDRHLVPVVNYLLVALNVVAFIFWQGFGIDEALNSSVTFAYATVPGEILTGTDIITENRTVLDPITQQQFIMPGLGRTPVPVFFTLFTSLFLHGGIGHLVGNMLYLLIFGDNLENKMGHTRYFIFYMLSGMLAGLCHVFATYILNQDPLIPAIGASGAISAVLGGYILLFPTRRIRMWFLLFSLRIPAFIVVGLWFIFQVLNGIGTLGGEEGGGIAYAAHIGGFIVGLLITKSFVKKTTPKVQRR